MKSNFLVAMMLLAVSPSPPSTVVYLSDVSDIPTDLRQQTSFESLRRGLQAGDLLLDATARTVAIRWTASKDTNSPLPPSYSAAISIDLEHDAVGQIAYNTTSQTFSTRDYMPTASCVVDGLTAVVCGLGLNGSTIIETWSFAWPTPMPPVSINPVTGMQSVGIVSPARSAITRIYDADMQGKRIVRNITGLRKQTSSTTHLLVQFNDSLDVYVMPMAGGAMQLLASSTQSSGTLGQVAALGIPYNWLAFGQHQSLGYLYSMSTATAHLLSPDVGSAETPTFIDSDRDGDLDTVAELTQAERTALGANDLGNYIQWWLP